MRIAWTPYRRALAAAAAGGVGLIAATGLFDLAAPPPLERAAVASPIVVDRNGRWLHAYTTPEGRWRFRANLDEIDPRFVERLVAVEDKRFWKHGGVDPLAVARAGSGALASGRISSGASTITMQAARLLEPRPRTIPSKIIEMFRAAQIERRLSKRQVLELYLTLTPYGGNVEGVRAASLLYFDKEPRSLTDAEQALLIALPQAPEARRPDRRGKAARDARDGILAKFEKVGVIEPRLAAEAREAGVRQTRSILPRTAYHATLELAGRASEYPYAVVPSTLDIAMQHDVEALVAAAASRASDGATAAAIVIDTKTRAVRAMAGSAGVSSTGGWIDMSRALRSPGSTLKPFIYALAFDDGLLGPDTVIEDMPQSFDGYAPENFDRTFRGEITAADALQHSLNVPAVRVLDRIGAERLAAAFQSAGVTLATPDHANKEMGLTLALGGAGVTMRDLAALYAGLAQGGAVKPLAWTETDVRKLAAEPAHQIFSRETAIKVSTILEDSPALSGRAPSDLSENAPPVSMKTGTSYGYRDAWAAGHAGGYAVIVWVGRADGGSRPGVTGRDAAAPVLYAIFDALWRLDPNAGRGIAPDAEGEAVVAVRLDPPRRASAPEIVFPRDGVELYADGYGPETRGFSLSARGGAGGYAWYAGGDPVTKGADGKAVWRPTGPGFYDIVVIDGRGLKTTAKVRVVGTEQGP